VNYRFYGSIPGIVLFFEHLLAILGYFYCTSIVRLRRIYFIHPQKMPRGRRGDLILRSILHPKKMRFGQRGNLGFIHCGRLWAFENRAIRLNRRHPMDGHLSSNFIQKTSKRQGLASRNSSMSCWNTSLTTINIATVLCCSGIAILAQNFTCQNMKLLCTSALRLFPTPKIIQKKV